MQMIVDLQDLTGIIARTDLGFHSKVSNLLLSAKDAVLGRSRWDDIGLGIEALATEAMQRERSGRGNGWDGEESQVSAAVSSRHDQSRSFPGSGSDFPSHGSGNSSTIICRNLSSPKFLGAAVGRIESVHSPNI
ncbi:hypothetical protein M427DRAFT_55684 [Gonapodya prolifera JEL478]|uniref:Uncharacterized protein n=1 Tax=Gonapodya prolifera (strain JEL478) TaxID=1344416 RepID=A0A139AIJ8_GONPJ|nr:hypothetical protein M427DRAFT_55684 [Gonapodya prolifera JEL478]|eukprot:KXS16253.1 hypothetical protein M427DRAFT_55684 [Gonapodya prolifera JEL478]